MQYQFSCNINLNFFVQFYANTFKLKKQNRKLKWFKLTETFTKCNLVFKLNDSTKNKKPQKFPGLLSIYIKY